MDGPIAAETGHLGLCIALARGVKRGGSHFFAHNGLAYRGLREARQLKVLNPEMDANDGEKTGHGRHHMAQHRTYPGQQKPHDVAQEAPVNAAKFVFGLKLA